MPYRTDAELPETAVNQVITATSIREEEILIVDGRGNLSPTDEVEQKLLHALQLGSVPLSRLQKLYRPGGR